MSIEAYKAILPIHVYNSLYILNGLNLNMPNSNSVDPSVDGNVSTYNVRCINYSPLLHGFTNF